MTTLANTAPTPSLGLQDPNLDAIRQKVLTGERLTLEDGNTLYTTKDIWTVCELANLIRDRLHPGIAYYNINRHLNYSNICALSCKFCEFFRKKDQDGAYTHDLESIKAETLAAIDSGATEIHIVGGLHPYLPFDYYTDMLRTIRSIADSAGSNLHIKAFTAVEIVHFAKIAKRYKSTDRKAGIRWVLEQLKDAGLGSLPGGGAEVFDDRVHDEAFKGKIRSDAWLDVHTIAHELGLNSNCTILYGHIEQRAERLIHMDMLRRAQDQALFRLGYSGDDNWQQYSGTYPATADIDAPAITLTRPGATLPTPSNNTQGGYFQTIIPLPFFPDGSELEHLYGPSGLENLRTLAIARLMLDNFPHAKSFWIMQTLPMSQLMLKAGADDIDGTVVWYDITKVGGQSTHQETTTLDLQRAIREAGYEPVERDTLYRRIKRDEKEWHLAED
ncbi:MAG TPA: radical SAM protein [Phycisphaerales bacterium]|nr:radical SAM protein [Phycisphaerales bacterium]